VRPRKIAVLLVALGLVCLPAPIYLGWAAQATAPEPRTAQSYAAEPLDPANASDRRTIVDRHGRAVALSVHQVSDRYSAGEYRAPNATRRTLRAAMRTGTARADDSAVRADLRAIGRNATFVHDAYAGGERERYYRLRIERSGAAVRARPVTVGRVANATVERRAYRYGSLSPGARRTVDRIVRNASTDDPGYRPRVSDPFADRLPALVRTDGTVYSLFVYGHVDDFGPGFSGFVRGVLVAGVGVLLCCLGGGVYAAAWWRRRGDGSD
jgi:hypothetical protein